ncbi:MAG: 3D domain-containing protein [Patescibacteria group bacterium]
MINQIILRKIKYITIIVLSIFTFEFAFPHLALAQAAIEPMKIIQQEDAVQIAPAVVARLPETPDRPQPIAKKTVNLTVTAYSSTADQCGSTPFTTASGTQVRDGIIAANFLPIGTKVRFPDQFGDKIFIVEDRMAARFNKRADIWMPSRELAIQWGVRHIKMEIL